MLHSSHAATLQMDFLVPITLATCQRFTLWLTLTEKMWCQTILSSHKDRNYLAGWKQNNRGWDIVVFNRTGIVPIYVGDPYSTQNVWWWWWWNNVQILGVKLNTCSSTGDGRMCGCSQKLTAVQGALIPPQLGNHNKPLLGENLYRA